MNPVRCFYIEPTDRVRRQLRRYCDDLTKPCPSRYKYHNGHQPFAEGTCRMDETKVWRFDDAHETPPRDDPRWPTKCDDCDYLFTEKDHYQLFHDVIYVRKDTGEEFALRDAPVGAMWDGDWYPWKGPDGKCLVLRCPPEGAYNDWIIDGPSSNEKRPWTRTGEPPRVTANPSILWPNYHGWLRDGVLVEC